MSSQVVIKKKNIFAQYARRKHLVFLFIPALLYYIIFHYGPIYGIQIAFKDYKLMKGMFGSSWVGFENFKFLFQLGSFWEVFRNILVISVMKLAWGFPAPIIFAIVLSKIRNIHFKKAGQTLSYLPHFLSWVVMAGFFLQFLSPSSGPINIVLRELGIKPIYFVADPKWFRTVLVATKIWKEIGWGSIVCLATLAGIDPALYEAASMDGEPASESDPHHPPFLDTNHHDHAHPFDWTVAQ